MVCSTFLPVQTLFINNRFSGCFEISPSNAIITIQSFSDNDTLVFFSSEDELFDFAGAYK